MLTVRDIIEVLERLAPPEYAESWDNPGLLVGREDQKVDCIYVALDATDAAIDAAKKCGAQMIVTHHPMIFSPLKQVNDQNFISRRVLTLIENHISCYAMHTNFDVAKMADLAADRLALKNRDVLDVTIAPGTFGNDMSMGIGCCGTLKRTMTLRQCGEYVKSVFEIETVKIFGELDTPVYRVAVCPGSGKHMTEYALKQQCDVLITGDIDHHEGIDAVARSISVIDAGHHGIEHIFVEFMAQYLKEHLNGVDVVQEPNRSPFAVI